jgi:hypothetical protein
MVVLRTAARRRSWRETAHGAARIALCHRAAGSSCIAERNRSRCGAVCKHGESSGHARACAWPTQRGRVIEPQEPVEHHRWTPPADGAARGLAPLDGASLALLHGLRWRQPPRDRRRLWTGLALTLLLHLLFGALTWHELQPRLPHPAPVTVGDVLHVRLIARPATPAAVPPPSVPAPPPRAAPEPVRHVSREPVDKHAMTVDLPAARPPPKLYDASGRVTLPPAPASSAPPPAYVAGRLQGGDVQVLRHDAGDTYRSKDTRFAPYFPPPGESAVDTAIRKTLEKTIKTGTVRLPKGVRIHCSTVLFILPVGCGGDPPAPPPSNDGDERLSMAATPLTKQPHAPKPPSVEKCIEVYRMGKALPYGCPVDTPARAVDAQVKELELERQRAGH